MAERTVLLMGCGPVGMATARLLGKDKNCGKVIAADRSGVRAAAAAELCGEKAVSVAVDCLDDDAMGYLLRDSTVVVNTIQCTSSILIPLIRAVVESGASYTDATTDTASLQTLFDSEYLHALAGYRSVSVVPGLGSSPGLTNALTRYLGQRLERVEGAKFYLLDDLSRRSRRQWRDRLAAFGPMALVWRDQEWKFVPPLSEWDTAEFPHLSDTLSLYTVNLEPISLPYSFPSMTEASSHRGFSDGAMLEIVEALVRCGFAGEEPWKRVPGRSARWSSPRPCSAATGTTGQGHYPVCCTSRIHSQLPCDGSSRCEEFFAAAKLNSP